MDSIFTFLLLELDKNYSTLFMFLPYRSIRTKLLVRFSFIFMLLFALVVGTLFFSFRHLSIASSKNSALILAKTIRDGITSLMYLGVIGQRDIYLERIKETQEDGNIKKIKVLRGEKVIKQFGQPRVFEVPDQEIEFQVLKTGKMAERLDEFHTNPVYELVIPYKASSKGRVNCLQCHQAEEGDVLGAISIQFDLSQQRSTGINIIILVSLLAILAILAIFWMIDSFVKPYGRLFAQLHHGFDELEKGHLHAYVNELLDDEAGEVGVKFNHMLKTLSGLFNEISNKIYYLVGFELQKSGHAIQDTSYNIDLLINAYQFKRELEKDADNHDIYLRIQSIVLGMGLGNFAIYEFDRRKNSFRLITDPHSFAKRVDDFHNNLQLSEPQVIDNPHCHLLVGKNPRQCPVIRDGKGYNSDVEGHFCRLLRLQSLEPVGHVCVPLVGENLVVIGQILFNQESSAETQRLLPLVKRYFYESINRLEVNNSLSFIRDQSLSDELTGLYNRRYLEECSTFFLEHNIKKTLPMGFLMVDVDFFKKVNDELGHDAGDMVLKKISKVIKETVRETDLVIRFGGEEILILANNIQPGTAQHLAEKVRTNIEAIEFRYARQNFHKTASIGCAEYPRDSQHFWICIKNADTALYQAKETGRNRVVDFADRQRIK